MLFDFADDIDLIGIDRRAVKEAYVPMKNETAEKDRLDMIEGLVTDVEV